MRQAVNIGANVAGRADAFAASVVRRYILARVARDETRLLQHGPEVGIGDEQRPGQQFDAW